MKNKYKNMTQVMPLRNDYMPITDFLVEDVPFADMDDFEQLMYHHFFGTEQMQCKVFNNVKKIHVGRNNNDDAECFDSYTSLCNVAIIIRAFFRLLKNNNQYVVLE